MDVPHDWLEGQACFAPYPHVRIDGCWRGRLRRSVQWQTLLRALPFPLRLVWIASDTCPAEMILEGSIE